ncbi:MAG: hypothetical protein WC661_18835 [Opitutaceae bacterium]
MPRPGMLVRAIIPVFGTAKTDSSSDPLKIWYVEYGPGRNPKEWTRIKESQKPQVLDPWAAGKVIWNPNTGAYGNLANWNVGLQGYRYAQWRNNLNGIYTLRVVAESMSGDVSETQATVYVGEAIVRSQGGTAISADGACRVAVPSFSFGGNDSRVIAVIKQVPSFKVNLNLNPGQIDEVGGKADEIYATLGRDYQLYSPIYRVFPNGLKTDPALTLQIDVAQPPAANDQTSVGIYEWNPVVKRWSPLPTSWAGTTSLTQVNQITDYECYIAVLKRIRKEAAVSIDWHAGTALSGKWAGFTEPMSLVRVFSNSRNYIETQADMNGFFTLPFLLSPSTSFYPVQILSPDGDQILTQLVKQQTPGPVLSAQAPRLSTPLTNELSDSSPVYLICEDDALIDRTATTARSIAGLLRNSNFSNSFPVELNESVPGSGRFMAEIDLKDADSPYYAKFKTFQQDEILTFTVATSELRLKFADHTPPVVQLTSPTHACLFYASGNSPSANALTSTQNHSEALVEWAPEGAWKISGVGSQPSARVVRWNSDSININQWPLIGFTYRSVDARNWQLLLRNNNSIHTLNLGKAESYFRKFAQTTPLENRNEWIRWQQNLAGGPTQQLSSVSFGSWVTSAYLEGAPAFKEAWREPLWVRDLWIGRTYNEAAVQMNWKIQDASSLKAIRWWVNQDANSPQPPATGIQGVITQRPQKDDTCRFTVPESGTWYFHLQAMDAAGNTCAPTAFPLSIVFVKSATALLDSVASTSNQVTWEQPAGGFKVKLGDIAQTVALKGLRLVIGEHTYPISRSVIDYDTGTLHVSPDSFDETIPLGINGEALAATVTGNDINGRPLERIAQVQLAIKSPFYQEDQTNSLRIGVKGVKAPGKQWFAYWRYVNAPWMESFPGCVDNSLILQQADGQAVPKEGQRPIRWERPVVIVTASDLSQQWLEAMDTPSMQQAQPSDAGRYPTVGYRGGEIKDSNPSASWIHKITPDSPFAPGYVRVMISTKGSGIRVIRTTLGDAIRLLGNQDEKQTMRLDGMVAPTGSAVTVSLPGSASLQYSIGSQSSFSKTTADSITIEPNGEWQRFSLFFDAPPRKKTVQRTIQINGPFYW